MAKLSGLDLRIFNVRSRDRTLHPTAMFVVPYEDRDLRKKRIAVLYGGVVPFFKMDREGVCNSGSVGLAWSVKDIEIRSAHDVQAQVDGYLSLLRNTLGDPMSVVLVENPHSLEPQVAIDVIVGVYRHTYMDHRRADLKTYEREVIRPRQLVFFDPATPEGAARVERSKTMTAYLAPESEVLKCATLLISGKPLDKTAYVIGPER